MELKYINNGKYSSLKEVITKEFKLSNRLITKLKLLKVIYLNDEAVYINHPIASNDVITVKLDYYEDNSNILPIDMNLSIIYEDEYMLILNKPANMPIHPSLNHYTDSLSNGIKYYFDKIGLNKKIRIVNRLDKDTSGLTIIAKNEYIQEKLVEQMKNNTFCKEYIGIVEGNFNNQTGIIDANIKRAENSIIKRCVSPDGQTAITKYKLIKNFDKYSALKLILKTGRTHQIRVHLSHINHPILCDTLYGSTSQLISRQALHSYKVEFIHPVTNKRVFYIAPLFDDMKKLIDNYSPV